MATTSPAPYAAHNGRSRLTVSYPLITILLAVAGFFGGMQYNSGQNAAVVMRSAEDVKTKVSADRFDEFSRGVDSRFAGVNDQLRDIKTQLDRMERKR